MSPGPKLNAEDHKKVIEFTKSPTVDTDTAVKMTFDNCQEFRSKAFGKIDKIKIQKYTNYKWTCSILSLIIEFKKVFFPSNQSHNHVKFT